MATPTPAGKTLLVVDDDDVVRDEVASTLRGEGYAVIAAANGRQALDFLGSGPVPALVVLDMMMPEQDGWNFLARRAADPSLAAIPVLLVTAIGVASREWALSL